MKRVTEKELTRVLSEIGRRGGKASARSLTPEERRERARKAGLASAKAKKKEASHV